MRTGMAWKLRTAILGLGLSVAAVLPTGAKDGQPGVTDAQIIVGQTAPLSGPASAYSVFPKTATAYFGCSTTKAASTAARSS
jgi:hypothetical protein